MGLPNCSNGLLESDRVDEYKKRGHNWPPELEDYTPSTPGWKKLHERRWEQLKNVEDSGQTYDGFKFGVHSALNCKNFTENGWGLTRAPAHIIDLLLESLYEGLEQQQENPHLEPGTKVIDAEEPPIFISQPQLNSYIVNSLLPLHEAWAGVPLTPNNAYGLRVYRKGSNLNMHIDKTSTHIISSILHVDH